MKKRLIAGLVLLLAALCLCTAACAADDPLKFEMSLSTTNFTEPKSVTVGIKISNAGEGDMPGPVTLYYPNGKQVEEFGSPTLAVGQSKSWSGTWKVTQAQLEAGKVTFSAKYSVYNDSGELLNKTKYFGRTVTYDGLVASVKVNRTISPTTAEKGQQITVLYEIVNTGNTNVTDVSVKDSIGSEVKSIDAVNVGEKKTVSFLVTMGTKNLTSAANVTYKVGGKSYTVKKDPFTIKYGQVNLKASLTADKKGVLAGEEVKLTLTLKNTGKKDVTGITVTDSIGAELYSGQTVKAGETKTYERTVAVNETATYLYNITGTEGENQALQTATGSVSVTAMAPTDVVNLSVTAEADRDTVYSLPGTVKFIVSVTNNGEVAVNDVTIYASDVKLYSFPVIEAGETREFTRDIGVSMAGQYQFEARAQDKLNQAQRFPSNIIRIGYAQPTAAPTPVPTEAPPARPVLEPVPQVDDLPDYLDQVDQGLGTATLVLIGLAAIPALLIIIGLISRACRSALIKSGKIVFVLDHSHVTDYLAEIKGRKKRRTIGVEPKKGSAKAAAKDSKEDEDDKDVTGSEDATKAAIESTYSEDAVAEKEEVHTRKRQH